MSASPRQHTEFTHSFDAPPRVPITRKEVNSVLDNFIAKLYLMTRREDGQAMAEYGIILALVAVVCIAGFLLLGTQISAKITKLTDNLK